MKQTENIKTFKDIQKLFDSIEPKLQEITGPIKLEIQGLLKLISTVSDGSGLIDICIEQYPNFVPHVKQVRAYLSKLDNCAKLLNDNKWLSEQDEFDDSSSSSSGGGKSIIKTFDAVQYGLDVLNDVNLDVNCIFNLVYQLQHGQNKFYDKTKLQKLAKEYAKSKEQGKDMSKESAEIRDNLMGISKAKRIGDR